jgi:hypothetical protein
MERCILAGAFENVLRTLRAITLKGSGLILSSRGRKLLLLRTLSPCKAYHDGCSFRSYRMDAVPRALIVSAVLIWNMGCFSSRQKSTF